MQKRINLSMFKGLMLAGCFMMASAASAQTSKYVKVTEEPADWTGEYLILREYDDVNNVALVFNGALTELDVKDNYIQAANPTVTLGEKEVRVVEGSEEVDAATFSVQPSATAPGQYYIQSKSGYWIGFNSTDPDPTTGEIEPNLKASNTKQYDNSIAMEAGSTNVTVTAKNGFELRFNPDSGTLGRFRYHAAGKKKAIKFYKKEVITDGIVEMAAPASETAAYDLQGRRVAGIQKGLHIVGGKKYVVR